MVTESLIQGEESLPGEVSSKSKNLTQLKISLRLASIAVHRQTVSFPSQLRIKHITADSPAGEVRLLGEAGLAADFPGLDRRPGTELLAPPPAGERGLLALPPAAGEAGLWTRLPEGEGGSSAAAVAEAELVFLDVPAVLLLEAAG